MIDYGLLMSIILALAAPSVVMRYRQPSTYNTSVSTTDVMLIPGLVGVLVGRLATLSIDDPRAIGKLSDMLVVRSGVEFWPAVAAAVGVVAWTGYRDQVSPLARVADLTPYAIVGYGAYEVACIFRDGCFGPASPLGLKPDGSSTTMLPIGVLMGLGALVIAGFVIRQAQKDWPPSAIAAAAVTLVGTVRSLGSIWLPRVGGELTRQHRTSIVITVVAGLATAAELVRSRHQHVPVST